ncbi:MAG: hypothetical protein AAGA23_15105 [Pseudomonadota bacterium]
MGRYLAFLLLGLTLPAAAMIDAENVDALAVEMAYRLDRELGSADAARQHLLIWRLTDALESPQLTAGEPIQVRAQRWQQNLAEGMVPAPLPAWFAPAGLGVAQHLTMARLGQPDSADWNSRRGRQLVSHLAALLSEDLSPEWAAQQGPEVLAWARDRAPMIWRRFLTALADNPDYLPLAAPVVDSWLALPLDAPLPEWTALTDAAALEIKTLPELGSVVDLLGEEAQLLASEELLVERRNAARLRLAPYLLHLNGVDPEPLQLALLSLTRALAGAERGAFAELVRVLASLAEIVLVENTEANDEAVAAALEALRGTDDLLLSQLTRVDPGLQENYLRLRQLLGEALQSPPPQRRELLGELAALAASAEGHSSDLDGYLAQPVRAQPAADADICFDISQPPQRYPPEPISRDQFRNCLASFVSWGTELAQGSELAGEASGPFENSNLARELRLPPWQRINYWIGYLDRFLGADCGPFDERLVNPLEWALASASYIWFAERWPGYFAEHNYAADINRLMAQGEAALQNLRRMGNCRRFDAGAGRTALRVIMEMYAESLNGAVAAVGETTAAFRASQLEPGADVRLDETARQTTNYRPEDLLVGPCGAAPQCTLDQELQPSRALLGLLPQIFLVADQVRVGQLEACYENVRWIERRAEPAPVGNEAMASYFGRLSFDLRINSGAQAEPIRLMRLTSQEEFEYLFGANKPEVLEDPCPSALVGTQVQAELPGRRLGLVPNRLTFMTAGRAEPGQVVERHWAEGDEWRDRFVTGEGVEVLSALDGEAMVEATQLRLEALNAAWNQMLYQGLTGVANDSPLTEPMISVQNQRDVLDKLARLLAPQRAVNDPTVRAALRGRYGLFDQGRARQLAAAEVPANQVAPLALGYLEDARFLFAEGARGAEPLITSTLARLFVLARLGLPAVQHQQDVEGQTQPADGEGAGSAG